MLLWPFEGFVTLKAKSSGSRLAEAGSPLNYTVHTPVSPFSFPKDKTSCYNLESSELQARWEAGQ